MSPMPTTILIVDDEEDFAEAIAYNLQKDGHQVLIAHDGATALGLVEKGGLELVILDLMLPDLSGTELCRRIKAGPRAEVPVMMLTARGDEIDRVVGFEVGADDYMVKPISMRELSLRVRAIIRRHRPGSGSEAGGSEGKVAFGALELDPEAHRLWVDRREVELTALEFRLLQTFLKRRGRVQTRETLLLDVWGVGAGASTRTVDTHVKRLREKLGEARTYVETIRGVGYRFVAEPAPHPSNTSSAG